MAKVPWLVVLMGFTFFLILLFLVLCVVDIYLIVTAHLDGFWGLWYYDLFASHLMDSIACVMISNSLSARVSGKDNRTIAQTLSDIEERMRTVRRTGEGFTAQEGWQIYVGLRLMAFLPVITRRGHIDTRIRGSIPYSTLDKYVMWTAIFPVTLILIVVSLIMFLVGNYVFSRTRDHFRTLKTAYREREDL